VHFGINRVCQGGEAIVSRGEQVEIGGDFRIPDVMTESGAILKEVGATNRRASRLRTSDKRKHAADCQSSSVKLSNSWVYVDAERF
jgi:seryl-tRNA(Sec) selenium transferase